jgi:hypothetical protein
MNVLNNISDGVKYFQTKRNKNSDNIFQKNLLQSSIEDVWLIGALDFWSGGRFLAMEAGHQSPDNYKELWEDENGWAQVSYTWFSAQGKDDCLENVPVYLFIEEPSWIVFEFSTREKVIDWVNDAPPVCDLSDRPIEYDPPFFNRGIVFYTRESVFGHLVSTAN